MILYEILKKFERTPGQCNLKEIDEVKKFFNEYKEYRDAYKEVFLIEPTGLTLESMIDKVNWYENYVRKNHGD